MSVSEVIDASGFTSYQFLICTLCFFVTFLDGFDIMIIAVALPKMAEFLRVEPSALGIAMAAGQFGPLIGALVLGMLADNFGRKWMLILSAIIFGVFTLMTAFATSVGQVTAYRFLAGLGLGGAIPNALAFGSEYAPSGSKSTFITTMYAGMPVGGMMAGFSATWLIPHFGWQSLFVLGGIAPILIAILVAFGMPESLDFLVRRSKDTTRIRKIVARLMPALANDPQIEFFSSEQRAKGTPVKLLFTEGRAINTVLLWIGLAGSLYTLWVISSWAPTLLKNSGATVQQYSLAMGAIGIGATASNLLVGRVMDRINPFAVLTVGFCLAFVSLILFGLHASSPFFVIFILSIVCGVFINGSNAGFLAIVTTFYPSAIRGTGTGWAYAVAKIGAMAAPVMGGIFLSWNWSVSQICASNGVAALLVAAVVVILGVRMAAARTRSKTELAGTGSDQ
jgi:MFS transporter, AAHS family, 4-hydroxybenzoate transporter